MGIYVECWDIVRKTKDRNEELRKVIEASKQSVLAMRQCGATASQGEELQGKAWNSVRSYIAEVQAPLSGLYCLWAEAQIEANNRYAQEADALPWDSVDEEGLQRERTDYIIMLDIEKNRPENEQSKSNITHYEREIDRLSGYIMTLHYFCQKTALLYDEAEEYQAQLDKVDTELAKVVFNADMQSIDYSQMDSKWKTTVDDKAIKLLESRGIYKDDQQTVLKAGISLQEQLWMLEEMEAEGAYTIEKDGEKNKIKFYDMEELGYTYADIICIWSTLAHTEKPFMAKIMIGTEEKYKEAFLTDPNDLTDNMTLILSDYSYRLVNYATEPYKDPKLGATQDISLEKLGYFINGILAAEKPYDGRDMLGITYTTDYLYRDIYLERLTAGTELLMENSAVLLAYQKKEGIRDEDLWKKYELQFGVCSCWYSIMCQVNKEPKGFVKNCNFSVNNVYRHYDGTEVQIGYYRKYYQPSDHSSPSRELRSGKLQNTEIGTAVYLNARERLKQQKDKLELQFTLGAFHILVNMLCPEYALITGAALLMTNKTTPGLNVTGMLEGTSAEPYGKAIDGTYQGAGLVIDTILAYENIQNQINELDNNELWQWFGARGTYGEVEIDEENENGKVTREKIVIPSEYTFGGCYDPEGLYYILMIQEKGMGLKEALRGTDVDIDAISKVFPPNEEKETDNDESMSSDVDIDTISEEFPPSKEKETDNDESRPSNMQAINDMRDIWNGGFSFDEEDSVERFAKAVSVLNGNSRGALGDHTLQYYLQKRSNE